MRKPTSPQTGGLECAQRSAGLHRPAFQAGRGTPLALKGRRGLSSQLHYYGFFRADVVAGAAGDALVLVELPDFLLAVDGERAGGAFLGAERAVDALGRVVDGQAVLARLDGAFSLGRAGTGGGFFFGGLFLQVCKFFLV